MLNQLHLDDVILRGVSDPDLTIFFANQSDPEASRMAAFTAPDPGDESAFIAHWRRILDDEEVIVRTIVRSGEVAGYVLSYVESGRAEVSYWIGKAYWGQGIATAALALFLAGVNNSRPIFARAAADNRASVRVLEKCGFKAIGRARGFANARGEEIEELVFAKNEDLSVGADEL